MSPTLLFAALLATEPVGPQPLSLGPVVFNPLKTAPALTQIDPRSLQLNTCLTGPSPSQPEPAANDPIGGEVRLQVTIRRGQAKLVTTTSVSSGLEWLTPCLERQLAEWTWPIGRARLEVQVPVEKADEEDKKD